MSQRTFQLGLLVAIGIALAGCGREPAAPEAQTVDAPQPQVTEPEIVPPSTEIRVQRVESVMVTRPQEAPQSLRIQVSGLVDAVGWTDARLVPLDNDADDKTKSFSFVAKSPRAAGASTSAEIVEAELELNEIPVGTEMIRVVGATNEVSAFMP